MAINAHLVFPKVKGDIQCLYGVGCPEVDGEKEHNGPYSYVSFLHELLRTHSCGDNIVLYCLSLMWRMKITVIISSPHPTQLRFHHDSKLAFADLVLVYNGRNHFNAVGTLMPYHYIVEAGYCSNS